MEEDAVAVTAGRTRLRSARVPRRIQETVRDTLGGLGIATRQLLETAARGGLNRKAMRQLGGETRLEIVPGASHLFEEPGTLEQVARLAGDWFTRHLTPGPRAGHNG